MEWKIEGVTTTTTTMSVLQALLQQAGHADVEITGQPDEATAKAVEEEWRRVSEILEAKRVRAQLLQEFARFLDHAQAQPHVNLTAGEREELLRIMTAHLSPGVTLYPGKEDALDA